MINILMCMLLTLSDPAILSEPPQQEYFIGDTFTYHVKATEGSKIYLNAHKDLTLDRQNVIRGTFNKRCVYRVTVIARQRNLCNVQQFYIRVRWK